MPGIVLRRGMSANEIGVIVAAFLLGAALGFGWAQSIYRKWLHAAYGYSAEYREMIDELRR